MSRRSVPAMFEVQVGDLPGHTLIGFECRYPDAPDGGVDLVTPEICHEHQRSIYWCLNASVFWCDGGPPDYQEHIAAHLR